MDRKTGGVLAAGLLLPVLLCACARQPAGRADATPPPAATPAASPAVAPAPEDPARQLLETMTLREKIGQLFVVRPDALDPEHTQEQIDDADAPGVTELTDAMRQTLAEYPVGGICQFGKNLVDPEQIRRFNGDLQAASTVPLFLCVDEEGGAVARLANHPGFDLPQYESAAAVGASGNPEDAFAMGQTIGAYLQQYGFTLDFAPVGDVNTNPENPVIGTRAFSSDPETAAAMAGAMARGLNDQSILPVIKHFPGHGDTAEDSHDGLAYTYRTRAEMDSCEFLPFVLPESGQGGIGPHGIMVGHIAAPELTGDDTPASLSRAVVTDLLREQLLPDADTLIFTDSLAMGAITARGDAGQTAVQALQAGCDVLLMPAGLAQACDGVLAAVESGELSEAEIDDHVYRILRMKETCMGLPSREGGR